MRNRRVTKYNVLVDSPENEHTHQLQNNELTSKHINKAAKTLKEEKDSP